MPVCGISKQPLSLHPGIRLCRLLTAYNDRPGPAWGPTPRFARRPSPQHRARKTAQPMSMPPDLVRLLRDRRLFECPVRLFDHARRLRVPAVLGLDERLAPMSADRGTATGGHARRRIEIANAEGQSSALMTTQTCASLLLLIAMRPLQQLQPARRHWVWPPPVCSSAASLWNTPAPDPSTSTRFRQVSCRPQDHPPPRPPVSSRVTSRRTRARKCTLISTNTGEASRQASRLGILPSVSWHKVVKDHLAQDKRHSSSRTGPALCVPPVGSHSARPRLMATRRPHLMSYRVRCRKRRRPTLCDRGNSSEIPPGHAETQPTIRRFVSVFSSTRLPGPLPGAVGPLPLPVKVLRP